MKELLLLKEQIKDLIKQHNKINGKDTTHEQAYKKVIELIDSILNSTTSNIKTKNKKSN